MTNKKTDKPQVEELNDTDLEKASGGYYKYELKNLKNADKHGWKVEEGEAGWKVEEGEAGWKVEEGEKLRKR